MKKILIILLLGFISRTLISCCDEGENFIWTEINNTLVSNISSNEPIPISGDSTEISEFAIELKFIPLQLAEHEINLGFSHATATSCEPMFPNTQSVINYSFILLTDLNEQFKKGDDISSILTAKNSGLLIYPNLPYEPIENMIEYINNDQFYDLISEVYYLKLNAGIADATEFKLEIKMELNNGEILQTTTKNIILKN